LTKEDKDAKDCQHDWCYANAILTSYPPQQDRICRLCGLTERVTVGEYVDPNEYDRLKERFTKEGE
jgi:hypothetical protein